MKKVLSLITVIVLCLCVSNVNARTLDEEYFKSLNVTNVYVCGNYMLDIGKGFQVTLRDFMIASRSIPEGEETTLYHIQYAKAFNRFTIVESYSNETLTVSSLGLMSPARLYRNSIWLNNPDFDELS